MKNIRFVALSVVFLVSGNVCAHDDLMLDGDQCVVDEDCVRGGATGGSSRGQKVEYAKLNRELYEVKKKLQDAERLVQEKERELAYAKRLKEEGAVCGDHTADELKQKFFKLKCDKERLDYRFAQQEVENKALKDEVTQKRKKIAELNNDLRNATRSYEQACNEMNRQKKVHADTRARVEREHEQCKQLRNEIAQLKSQVQEKEKSLSEMQKELESTQKALECAQKNAQSGAFNYKDFYKVLKKRAGKAKSHEEIKIEIIKRKLKIAGFSEPEQPFATSDEWKSYFDEQYAQRKQ